MILPAVGMGLVVDDTIHTVWGVRRLLRGGQDLRESLTELFATTGRAIVLTTVVLAAGFASLAASAFVSNIELALSMPLLLFIALIFDVLGVPAWLLFLERRGFHLRTW